MEPGIIENYEAIIIGAGAAGLKSANELAVAGVDFHIVEANAYIGGRIKTEIIEHDKQPKPYKFEHGAAWIHGEQENPLYLFFKTLYEKHNPGVSFDDKITRMFRGNIWVMPEYLPYDELYLVDGLTGRRLTREQHHLYLITIVLHLRPLLRTSEDIMLSLFVPAYLNFISNLPLKDADVIARAVAWYFQTVESYSGISTGELFSSDLFSCKKNTSVVLSDLSSHANYYSTLLDQSSQERLLSLLQNADQIDFNTVINEYEGTDTSIEDAHTQGCGVSAHCTIDLGMSTVISLLLQDIKYYLYCHKNGIPVTQPESDGRISDGSTGGALSAPFDHTIASSIANNDSIEIPISLNTQVIKIEKEDSTGCPLIYTNTGRILRATRGIIMTASVNSMDKFIRFPPQSTMTKIRDQIINSSWIVFYKKVVFCFEDAWWNTPQAKIVGITQDATNTYGPTNGITKEDLIRHHQQYLYHTKYGNDHATDVEGEGDDQKVRNNVHNSTFLDVAGGSYPSLFRYALALPKDYWKNPSKYDTSHEQLARDMDALVIASGESGTTRGDGQPQSPRLFSSANLIWESHRVNKGVNVLSCSIVGNLGRQIVGFDDDVVCNMVMSHLHRIFNGMHQEPSVNAQMPSPLWSRVTRWAETPTMGQSYTLIVDCAQTTMDRICGAQEDRVWFAGEAIDVMNAGSIQGAISTGHIAAHKLLQSSANQHNDKLLI